MKKTGSEMKNVMYLILVPAVVTCIITAMGYINHRIIDIKTSFIVFAGLCFFWIVITFTIQGYKELIIDFLKEDIRGKILLIIILLSMILKAVYEIRFNN